MTRFCQGCGAQLQSENEQMVGYILPQHAETGLCQRCFKIKQYSEFHKVDIDNDTLIAMIDNYDRASDLLTLVVDISDLKETCLLEIAESLQERKLIVVVNKIDIILKDMRRYDLWEQYLSALFTAHDITVQAFFFVSAKEQLGIKRLISYYEKLAFSEIKIIGCANVGKSSLIQALFRDSAAEQVVMPTIFMTPGTTLEEFQVPWGQKMLYDTPGIMKPQQLTYYLPPKAIKSIALQKPIRPKNYQVYEPQTFFIGGYAQVNVWPKGTNTITFFVSNTVPIHRKKMVEDDSFFQAHIGELLAPPTRADLAENKQLLEREKHDFTIEKAKQDVVISGLGWVSFYEADVKIEIITVAGVQVYEQPAIV